MYWNYMPKWAKRGEQGSVLHIKIQGRILNILTELVDVMINLVNFESCYKAFLTADNLNLGALLQFLFWECENSVTWKITVDLREESVCSGSAPRKKQLLLCSAVLSYCCVKLRHYRTNERVWASTRTRLFQYYWNARPQKRCTTICTKVTGAARTAVMLDGTRARNRATPRSLLLSTRTE